MMNADPAVSAAWRPQRFLFWFGLGLGTLGLVQFLCVCVDAIYPGWNLKHWVGADLPPPPLMPPQIYPVLFLIGGGISMWISLGHNLRIQNGRIELSRPGRCDFIRMEDIAKIIWDTDKIEIAGRGESLKIDLMLFSRKVQADIVQTFRRELSECPQDGWKEFAEDFRHRVAPLPAIPQSE